MVMFPLTFLSNAFVPVDTMPGWLQAFVNGNPISILATAVRGLFHWVKPWALQSQRCGSSVSPSSAYSEKG
jgi:ABC-type multidrug transport system permease subunit